jgi:hypothetical protein
MFSHIGPSEITRRSLTNDFAPFHDEHAVSEFPAEIKILFHQQDRDARRIAQKSDPCRYPR